MEHKRLDHLAVIMDGNRRWARQQGLFFWQGHEEGVNAARRSMEFCLEKKIPYLSLYTFSIENFKRSAEEKSYLFALVGKMAQKSLSFFKEHMIKATFIGDRSLFPVSLMETLNAIEKETENFAALQVNFLFCYGGRQEILGGVKKIIQRIKDGDISEDNITESEFASCLWTHSIPEPDLIIRTGGEQRLSNFLLFQAAYTELYFIKSFWPEIQSTHLQEAVDSYYQKQGNYGV